MENWWQTCHSDHSSGHNWYFALWLSLIQPHHRFVGLFLPELTPLAIKNLVLSHSTARPRIRAMPGADDMSMSHIHALPILAKFSLRAKIIWLEEHSQSVPAKSLIYKAQNTSKTTENLLCILRPVSKMEYMVQCLPQGRHPRDKNSLCFSVLWTQHA